MTKEKNGFAIFTNICAWEHWECRNPKYTTKPLLMLYKQSQLAVERPDLCLQNTQSTAKRVQHA